MRLPVSDICVLCGVRSATTRDHVPPKGLFKGLGVQQTTVPACAICNNGSSSYDEDVRFYISAQIGKQAAGSAKLWEDGAHKSIKRKATLRKQVVGTTREVETVDANGNRVVRLAFEAPVEAYQVVFERTTRGLYFAHTARILPPATPIVVDMLRSKPDFSTEEIAALTRRSIGADACVYRYGIDDACNDSSLWIYEFYSAHWVMVKTGLCADSAF